MSEDTEVTKILMDQNKALGRIEQKIDNMDAGFGQHLDDYKTLNGKVEVLEGAHNRMKGAIGVWSVIVTAVSGFAGWYFGNKGN